MADSAPDLWAEFVRLQPGEHLHLNEVVDGCPAPGSRDWLPIVRQGRDDLSRPAGHWFVSLPVGYTDTPPMGALDVSSAFGVADASELLEPPAVYRWPEGAE